MSNKTEEALRREVRDAFFNPTLGLHRSVDILDHPNVRKAFDAYDKAVIAANKPTFEGDEAEVREPGWSKVMLWLEERMNFPTQSQPLRLAALKMCGEHYLANKRCDEALSRAEQAEAALSEERKAMSEAASYAIEDLREWLVNYPDAYDRDTTEQAITTLSRFILPAKPAVDPLVAVLEAAGYAVFPEDLERVRAAIERAGGVKAVFGEGL